MQRRIEAIKWFHSQRGFGTGENLEQAQRDVAACYRSLSVDEIRTLAQFAVDSVEGEDNDAEYILSHLACFHPGCLTDFQGVLVLKGVSYPAVIYHGASGHVAQRIIGSIDDENRNLKLLAMAWIGDETVLEAFAAWKKQPPAWVSQLHVPPHAYADEAGWEFVDGQRRNLVLDKCHPLVLPTDDDAVEGVVSVNVQHEDSCQWCGRQLTTLLDWDLKDDLLRFCDVAGDRLRISTCDVCTCYGMIFTNVDWNGKSEWHVRNQRPEYLPDDSADWDRPTENALRISKRTRTPLESADRNMPIKFSQVGGYPSWDQDAEFPVCPSCDQKMVFMAQICNGDFEPAEGLYYMFLCRGCQVAATHYQQT